MTKTGLIAAAAVAVFLQGGYAQAAGESSDEKPRCINGKVWDKKQKKCVRPTKESNLGNDALYEAGRDLANAKRYGEALTVLSLASDRSDPRILNYLGFVNRKLGNRETAMDYYRQALDRDPDYILARSYMGEALALNGQTAEAYEQLQQIALRGGTDTHAYRALERVLKTGVAVY